MKIESQQLPDGSLEVKLTFDDHDQKCLQHDLLDIAAWYASGPCHEKIANCRGRMIDQYRLKVLQSDSMQSLTVQQANELMADPVKMVNEIVKLPEYKNRRQREDALRI